MHITSGTTNTLADRIDAWLPQTQCTQCGYPRCRAYAEAVASGEAGINQCPPGGDVTLDALATLRNIPRMPLDPRYGVHGPRLRAVIDEAVCIGCRKCLDVCPTDAILGARKKMHTVIAAECSGCALCLPPCPVDCITMVPSHTGHARSASGSPPSPVYGRGNEGEGNHTGEHWPEYTQTETERWRGNTERRLQRMQQRKQKRHAARQAAAARPSGVPTVLPHNRPQIRAEIRAAVARSKGKKRAVPSKT